MKSVTQIKYIYTPNMYNNQCCGSGSVWIRFILVSRIRIFFHETDPDPGSKKSAKIMETFHKNQQKFEAFWSDILAMFYRSFYISRERAPVNARNILNV